MAEAQKAIFAAGCFWGVEEIYRVTEGVLETRVGYIGGHKPQPTYHEVCEHGTGHAEAVEVTFDPAKVSYETLLEIFWDNHNPTTLNRQGPDVGDQYRSAVFYLSDEQKQKAEASRDFQNQKHWDGKIVTQINSASHFWPAEEYHQKYLLKNNLGNCHI